MDRDRRVIWMGIMRTRIIRLFSRARWLKFSSHGRSEMDEDMMAHGILDILPISLPLAPLRFGTRPYAINDSPFHDKIDTNYEIKEYFPILRNFPSRN